MCEVYDRILHLPLAEMVDMAVQLCVLTMGSNGCGKVVFVLAERWEIDFAVCVLEAVRWLTGLYLPSHTSTVLCHNTIFEQEKYHTFPSWTFDKRVILLCLEKQRCLLSFGQVEWY